MNIEAPHIPLGITLEEGLSILKGSSSDIEKHDDENELFYKTDTGEFEFGFYENSGKVISSWYNDPTGRGSEEGINQKVSLYLSRYGNIEDWEDGINNGWIQFFINNTTNIGMAYGLHKDVIRFNCFE
jgi:hypothetical protein